MGKYLSVIGVFAEAIAYYKRYENSSVIRIGSAANIIKVEFS